MLRDIDVSVSVVSHGQMRIVVQLLGDMQLHCCTLAIEVILTINTQAEESPDTSAYTFPVTVLRNDSPKGFGANHNQAFGCAKGKFFCVVNPDIRLTMDPLVPLVGALAKTQVGLAAPVVVGPDGAPEDSARAYPTLFSLLRRLVTGRHSSAHKVGVEDFYPPWVGGMFMLVPQHVFAQIKGFDERFFLYYEDVDLCGRLKLAGWQVIVCSSASVVHHAQRSSHKSVRYFSWHLISLVKYFTSATFIRLWMRGHL
jgi:N-acetylglucosaminyl-diphospho-decaprenol L-rhamnosyltransferase